MKSKEVPFKKIKSDKSVPKTTKTTSALKELSS